ncbi:MAG: MoaD/ThiS family protein [Actinobacteria bacterium]|nr:MoaD/ThiS family protein [Actinomycetota bacterium]
MAVVRLRAPLSELAGRSQVPVEGATVADALQALERAHPALAGWILDERGAIRRHINVFVDGELGALESPVGADARIHVLPAITGG